MVQEALIKLDNGKCFLTKNCHKNDLIMCIVVHETRRQREIIDC